jgi:hypothetical protein
MLGRPSGKNCFRNLVNHMVLGGGLYLAAVGVERLL